MSKQSMIEKLALPMFITGVLAMVASVFLISINLGSRFSQADNTLMAIGRRLVDVKSSLETVGKLETTLGSARSALQADTFDRSKVEAIKLALRDGNYPLDSRRIAESFVAIERLIDA